MKNRGLYIKCFLIILGILLLIFDGKTAFSAAQQGVELCLYTVFPSLFPFVILSFLLNSILLGKKIVFLRPLSRLCGVPSGGESLLLLGLIGGYPIGAQAAADAYRNGSITAATYRRLLGFCNNAGPSFIFGLVASQFASAVMAWAIWGIHMASAILVGVILPHKESSICNLYESRNITLPLALNTTLKIMAKICGWVILFRVLIAFLLRFLSTFLTNEIITYLSGLLELTNGCVKLSEIPSDAHRFIAAVCMLNFGGLCVGMQTASVCEGLGTGMYFPGKLLQTVIGLILSVMVLPILFSRRWNVQNAVLTFCAASLLSLVIFSTKKWWQFRQESYIMKAVHLRED